MPNFSEGRRKQVIESIANSARSVAGVTVLDVENDANHNRMVLTFVGSPEAVKEAALRCSAKAIELIDLTKHKGEHPRMGAVDVVPFVPLNNASMQDCIELANEFAKEFSERFDVPVFLYESAARTPARRNLADVRQGEFEGLRDLIGRDPSKDPDYGPKRIHPTAGATAVGARPILIAYNVNLRSTDLSIAKKIAKLVRERDGGLPSVKALGFEIKDKGMVQVSMNLTDYTVTPIHVAFDRICELAAQSGVEVAESEIVGLVPLDALNRASVRYLKLSNFKSDQIIESRVSELRSSAAAAAQGSERLVDLSVSDFLSRLASKEPVPGGGSASALGGAMAAALVEMVCGLTMEKKGYEGVRTRVSEIMALANTLQTSLEEMVSEDAKAYARVSQAYKLPRQTEEERASRTIAIKDALKSATEVPAKTAELSYQAFQFAREITAIGNKNAKSDAETATEMARAAVKGALSNVLVNLESLDAETEYCEQVRRRIEPLIRGVQT